MATISAADVKKLRDLTAAGMMECKKALEEADGDFDKAVEILRISGAAKAAKRGAEREAVADELVHVGGPFAFEIDRRGLNGPFGVQDWEDSMNRFRGLAGVLALGAMIGIVSTPCPLTDGTAMCSSACTGIIASAPSALGIVPSGVARP